jgi:hypothetical protein
LNWLCKLAPGWGLAWVRSCLSGVDTLPGRAVPLDGFYEFRNLPGVVPLLVIELQIEILEIPQLREAVRAMG